MGIHRLNHAVLYVSDLARSVAFYTDVLGFRLIPMTPDGFAGAAFLQAPDSTNDHDLGLFEVGAGTPPSDAGRTETMDRDARRTARPAVGVGLYHLAWEVDTLAELERTAHALAEAGALVGSSDHGTTKSLYGRDPDGLEFEIVWLIPADRLADADRDARKRIRPLDLRREQERFGADTLGGVGISIPPKPVPAPVGGSTTEVCRTRTPPWYTS